MPRFQSFALVLPAWLLASCVSAPVPTAEANWIDEKAFRACLGTKVPMATIRDPNFRRGTVSLDIDVLASGKIASVSVVSGSGNAAMDEYLVRRLTNLQCPIANLDSTEPYTVNLELTIEVER